MSREIKFRAKRQRNGVWVYGSYVTNQYMRDWIFKETFPPVKVEVDPQTVGEYTGKQDEEETDIYEGDIIQTTYEDAMEQDGIGTVNNLIGFHDGAFCWKGEYTEEWHLLDSDSIKDAKVIGNIHDNPELLEDQ